MAPTRPPPAHLRPGDARQFSDRCVVAAYHRRPPYPCRVFDRLATLVAPGSTRILDLGAGPGEIARGLARPGLSVDALDASPRMIERGRLSPDGAAPGLRRSEPTPWDDPVQKVIDRHSTTRRLRPDDLVAELVDRGLFRPLGRPATAAVPFQRPIADDVESFHARNGFSRDRMTADDAAAVDREVATIVAPLAPDGVVRPGIIGTIA